MLLQELELVEHLQTARRQPKNRATLQVFQDGCCYDGNSIRISFFSKFICAWLWVFRVCSLTPILVSFSLSALQQRLPTPCSSPDLWSEGDAWHLSCCVIQQQHADEVGKIREHSLPVLWIPHSRSQRTRLNRRESHRNPGLKVGNL